MKIKTNITEFLEFINDNQAIPNGSWIEDEEFLLDDVSVSYDDIVTITHDSKAKAKLTILCGDVIFDPELERGDEELTVCFKRWRKSRNTEYITFSVEKDLAQTLKDAIKKLGGKLI